MDRIQLWITGTEKPVLTSEELKANVLQVEVSPTDYVKIKAMENLTNAINKLRGSLK